MKTILRIIIAMFTLLIVLGILLVNNLDNVMKSTVNDRGEELLGIPLSVTDIKIDIFKGQVTLINLGIKNPPGFEAADAMSFATLFIDISPLSIFNSVVEIDEILIAGATINAEQKGKRLNLDVLRKRLTAASHSPLAEADTDSEGSLPDVAISKFEFSSASVSVRSTQLGETTLSVPSIVLTDIGSPDNGVSAETAMRIILDHLLKEIRQLVRVEVLDKAVDKELNRQIDKAMQNTLGDKAEQAKSMLKALFK